MSAHGIASRRDAEKMIVEGRVSINGKLATLGQSAMEGIDVIEVDGVVLASMSEHVYIMLNKPRGFVTTVRDERGRKTVMSLIEDVDTRVYPVGRLDMNSEGLLLLTNDGQFANAITHPSHNITKMYEVHVRGDLSDAIDALRKPINIESHLVQAVSVELVRQTEKSAVLSLIVSEGRNRQIRKMCELCGLDVRLLKRTAIGNVMLGSLRTGKWRHLTNDERKELER